MNRRPSKGLTFFLSFCTGVGHLYLGAMTRGLQFLLLFFGSFALSGFLPLGIFPFWIPIIWFYGLFDALQLADQDPIQDKPLLEWRYLQGRWTGFILIALGLLLVVDDILPSLWDIYFREISLGWLSFRTVLMAVILIIAGIILLRGKKVKQHDGE